MHEEERVTVGRRFRDAVRADRASGADHILDDDSLAEHFAEASCEEAADHVPRASSLEWHHHSNRPVRIILGDGRIGSSQEKTAAAIRIMRLISTSPLVD